MIKCPIQLKIPVIKEIKKAIVRLRFLFLSNLFVILKITAAMAIATVAINAMKNITPTIPFNISKKDILFSPKQLLQSRIQHLTYQVKLRFLLPLLPNHHNNNKRSHRNHGQETINNHISRSF